ncbi:serine/threonine protein kinase [Streptomyces sp. NPDC056682]|uniref:serine/threonine protein kinase n=1 Tax=Streptomyces sp. NPDC056682 TaxID=3345909 RepID=UPI00368B86CE
MAPEQFEGRGGVDERTDLYAVGVLLFELLTGTVPFDADTGNAIGYQHCTMPPPTLTEEGADVPLAVEDIVARALAKRRQDRFPDARSMRTAVESLLPKQLEEHLSYRPTLLDGSPSAGMAHLHEARTQTGASAWSGDGGCLREQAFSRSEARPDASPAQPAYAPPYAPAPSSPVPQPPVPGHGEPPTTPLTSPALPLAPRSLKERRRLVGRSYGLVVVTLLLYGLVYRTGTRGLVVLPAASSGYGLWLAGKGGVESLTEARRVGSGLLQISALLPLVIHATLALAALIDLGTVLSAP